MTNVPRGQSIEYHYSITRCNQLRSSVQMQCPCNQLLVLKACLTPQQSRCHMPDAMKPSTLMVGRELAATEPTFHRGW